MNNGSRQRTRVWMFDPEQWREELHCKTHPKTETSRMRFWAKMWEQSLLQILPGFKSGCSDPFPCQETWQSSEQFGRDKTGLGVDAEDLLSNPCFLTFLHLTPGKSFDLSFWWHDGPLPAHPAGLLRVWSEMMPVQAWSPIPWGISKTEVFLPLQMPEKWSSDGRNETHNCKETQRLIISPLQMKAQDSQPLSQSITVSQLEGWVSWVDAQCSSDPKYSQSQNIVKIQEPEFFRYWPYLAEVSPLPGSQFIYAANICLV